MLSFLPRFHHLIFLAVLALGTTLIAATSANHACADQAYDGSEASEASEASGAPDTSAATAPSKPTIKIVLPYIPLMAESPDHGIFIDLYRELATRIDRDIVLDVVPPRRAAQAFADGDYDAYGTFPSLSALPVSMTSAPFYVRENLIFYNRDQFEGRIIQGLSDLAGHQVGLSPYHYPPAITQMKGVHFERVPSDQSLLNMLGTNRLDAAIIERFSGFYLRDQLGLTDAIDVAEDAATTENIFALFQADRAGIENQKVFNLAIYDMLCDGTLADIFG
ncbi:substrate-binding periplasmic protein, partial [Thalassospira lucentensis]|uniref:substrate-binding periplasmic protein n=1 Tax=Thalassospira lucentensis TaxID=168935 RepID=UPI003AA846A3